MKYILGILFLFIFVNAEKNHLVFENSPYLREHMDNPVDWYPYSSEIFSLAKKEHKPVYISIGYSSCHWCHVMERESFNDAEFAQVLNRYFIAVKVDKEEMPALDSKYQQLFQHRFGRRAGWPLNVFLTPDAEVFYMAPYIPKNAQNKADNFKNIIIKLHKIYENPNKLKEYISKYQINQNTLHVTENKAQLSDANTKNILIKAYDDMHGGFGDAPKFPTTSALQTMLDMALLHNDTELMEKVEESLHVMAEAGLYDHIEGGFFRYCVDDAWEIPHFEKMLYTQAQLLHLYIRMYEKTKKEFYKDVAEDIIAFVEKAFDYRGAYLNAIDADLKQEEGRYYTFTPHELYSVHVQGSQSVFFDKDALHVTAPLSPQLRQNLLEIRAKKAKPFKDTKIITANNAMMISALFEAAIIDETYAKRAQKRLECLLELMHQKGELYHQRILPHRAKKKALLQDYAYLVEALLAGYFYDYDREKLAAANYFASQAVFRFYKSNKWYLNEGDESVEVSLDDKYYTGGFAKMMEMLEILALLEENIYFDDVLKHSMEQYTPHIHENPFEHMGSLRIALLRRHSVLVLKADKKTLIQKRVAIKEISYPYLYTKSHAQKGFLLCGLKQCFFMGRNLKEVKKFIKSNIRK